MFEFCKNMGLADIVKVREYDKVVETLRQGPSFGIHGMRKENYDKWYNEWKESSIKSYVFMGHYFAVGKQERQLPKDEFYKRLWVSTQIALNYSVPYSLHVVKKGVLFDRLPLLLLGIPQRGKDILIKNGKRSYMCEYWGGESIEAFPVGHDFIIEQGYTELCPLLISDSEIKTINRRMAKQPWIHGPHKNLVQDLFVSRELITRMIRKMYNVIKRY